MTDLLGDSATAVDAGPAVPAVAPVLPLRETVPFPDALTPLAIGLAVFALGCVIAGLAPTMAVLLGGVFMLLADILARALAWPAELPAGAVLALVGAPCFVWLVRRRG